jgi:transposase
MGMEKTDARTLNSQTQYEFRKQVIRCRKRGMTNTATAQTIGISEQQASTIWQLYLRDGIKALKLKTRGRRYGEKRTLTAEQEAAIQKLLVDKTPDQLKLPFALWTRNAVRLAIRERFRIDIPLRTISDYLKRWGFTPQKPVKRAYEQDPKKVAHWLNTTYPTIAARTKQEKAEIHWGDETGIQNDAYNAKGFSPKGKAPVIRLNGKKSSVNMISSVTNRGTVRFMLYQEKMSGKVLIRFMSRLIKDIDRKVFLILDNLPAHHGEKVSEWLDAHTKKIEVFYLPSYSPELNPDEYLNSDLKSRIRSGLPARSQNDLVKKTRSFMKTLQKRSKHVTNYFNHPKVAYAASSDI